MFDTKKAEAAKEIIQRQAVILFDQYSNLLLSFSTGCGKTKATLLAIEHQMMLNGLVTDKIYILLKESNHEQVWRDEIHKWKKDYLLDNITFFCYASLHKHLDEKVSLLVLDECHALSQMREDYLKTIKCDKIISLSATVDKFVKERIKSYKPGFYEYHIGLQDAIDKGILPEPTIKVVYIDLNDKEKKYEYPAFKRDKARKDYKPKMVTAKELYNGIQKKIDMWEGKWMNDNLEWAHTKWIQAMGSRKKIMATIKTDGLKRLLEILKDKRYICFTGSIDQCSEVGGIYSIHSKWNKERNASTISRFNEGIIDHIFAVGMLRESMNLNNIEAGIIGQLDNQSGSFYQMAGRSLRAIAPEIYILVLRDTKDEEYFDKATRSIASEYFSDFVWPQS